jgi:hypothetical protein
MCSFLWSLFGFLTKRLHIFLISCMLYVLPIAPINFIIQWTNIVITVYCIYYIVPQVVGATYSSRRCARYLVHEVWRFFWHNVFLKWDPADVIELVVVPSQLERSWWMSLVEATQSVDTSSQPKRLIIWSADLLCSWYCVPCHRNTF